MKKACPKGISAVLILGVIAIVSTIVISLISRSVVDVRISKQQEEQARVFSIAESALEKAFIGESLPTPASGEYDYQVTSLTKGGPGVETYVYPEFVEKDSAVTIWLSEHEGAVFTADASLDLSPTATRYQGQSLTVHWGEAGTADDPALVAVLYYDDGGDFKTETFPYDPDATRRTATTHFDEPGAGGTLSNQDFEWSAELEVNCHTRDCYFLVVRLPFADGVQPLGVEGLTGSSFPRQAECKIARATLQESGVSSRVQRCVLYKDYSPIFDFVLYSGQDLVKTGS